MAIPIHHNKFHTTLSGKLLLPFVFVLVMSLAGWVIPAKADPLSQETNTYCLSCHSNPELSLTLPDGEQLSLYISPESHSRSIHSQEGIECQACHTEITTYPHPGIEFQNSRELSRSYYQACQKCHPSNYEKSMDSIHADMANQGNLSAPICTDCHGAHDVQSPDEPRSLISQTCNQCHSEIYEQYVQSIHGSALIQEENEDVPVCTDCHGVHNIQDPRTEQFRINTPDLCANCHADAELMARYGLSADVYDLYELSWHGVDLTVYKAKWPTIWHDSAVCTDCHGFHDIRSTDDPASKVNPDNLLDTCQQCHPTAGPNWTDAWTGHYEISQEHTPFIFYVNQFYSNFASSVLWITGIYVLLQIIRSIVGRIQRSLP